MDKGQEVSMEQLCEEIGRDLYFINNDYIYKYFTLTDENYSKLNVDLKVIYNGGSSYSVYEQEKGNLLTIIRWNKRDDYFIVPVGVTKLLAAKVMGQFDLIERNEEFAGSVYRHLFEANELPDNERIEPAMYYLGVILFDTLGLDIYKSEIDMPDKDVLYIDAVKYEFVRVDDEEEEDLSYEEVIYIITAVPDTPTINCCKVYESRKDDRFTISIHDLIDKAYNELKADKK